MVRAIFACIAAALLLCAAARPVPAKDGSLGGVGAYGEAASKGMKSTVEKDLKDTMNSAQDAYNTAARTTYEEMVPTVEEIQEQAGECLEGIMDADFGFGLNVPSISSLLGAACRRINSEVKDHLQKASKKYSAQYMNGLIGSEMGVGMGGDTGPANDVDYQQAGEEISDQLWQDIKREKTWLK